jgi:MFS family permease
MLTEPRNAAAKTYLICRLLLQGIFTGLYFGLGQGLGGLVGGLLMQAHGGQAMFAMCSAIMAVGWALLGAAEFGHVLLARCGRRDARSQTPYMPLDPRTGSVPSNAGNAC